MIKLIGLYGKARSGKDTVANYLRRRYGFLSMSFAEGVREATAATYGVPVGLMFDEEAKELPLPGIPDLTVRQALINIGMGCRHTIGPDVWVDRWERQYATVPSFMPVAVKDVRMDNEAQRIRSLGGLILHIERPGAGLAGGVDAKGSEDGIVAGETDAMIKNDGTLSELYEQVDRLMAFLLVKRPSLQSTYNYTEK